MYEIANTLNGQMVVRMSDNAWIPFDTENVDYQAYLAWVEDGNVATEWTPDTANEAE